MRSPCQGTQNFIRKIAAVGLAGGFLGLSFVAGCGALLGVTDLVGVPDASSGDGMAPDARGANARLDGANSGDDAPKDGVSVGDGDSSSADSSIADGSYDAADVAVGFDSGADSDSSGSDGDAASDGAADVADASPPAPDANESGPFDAGFCATGTCRRVFVTATQMGDGNVGGLSGADGICQGAADVQGIGGIWKAWLSDGTSATSNRFVHASVPYRLLDGTLIANDWADLTSGSLRHPIDVDETPRRVLAALEVWTGTFPTGLGTGATCSDWTDASVNVTGTVGLTNASDAQWSDVYIQFCNRSNLHLYCFEQ